MPRWAELELSGWGRVAHSRSHVARPERAGDWRGILDDPIAQAHGLLVRGAGRSYGDLAQNGGGAVALTERLDRVLSFDDNTGVLVAEAGVTLGDLLRLLLPRGWRPAVLPGTGLATLGGAVANDVHGKNHHGAGSFGHHLLSIDLRLPDGRPLTVTPEQDPDLFRATVGGLGLTGIIERVAMRAVRAPSNAVVLEKRRIEDLDGFLSGFKSAHAEHVVGWIDALARGRRLGRGVLECADASPASLPARPARARRWPLEGPPGLLSPLAVRAFNACYWRRVPSGGIRTTVPIDRFLFPLDALHEWNRMYGRRGFHQFQCVLPIESGPRGLRLLLERISSTGHASFLAVLKAMGPEGRGMMSFPMPGLTLALDFPNAPGAAEFIAQLERITLDHGGRVYLAKDALLSPAALPRMYPQLPRFEQVLMEVDPQQRMRSELARRLGIRSRTK